MVATTAKMDAEPGPMPSRNRQLRTLDDLDGRTKGGRRAAELMAVITGELGGKLTALQILQVRRAAALAALSEDLATRCLAGEDVDLAEIVRFSNLLKREFQALGIKLDVAAKPRGPSIREYIASRQASPLGRSGEPEAS